MKVTAVEPIVVRIPFEDGGAGTGMTPQRWSMLDIVLVKVTTDSGLVGWGEAFGYFGFRAVAAAVSDLVAPLVVGQEIDDLDIPALNLAIQRKLVLFGRYGITVFALSGVDIALWDLKAKAAGTDLARLIAGGARKRDSVDAYASLVRYGDSDLVARYCEKAASQGYRTIKLHEITLPEIRAGRYALGRDIRFTIDVNCSWSESEALAMLPELRALDTMWLEEPIFPPEDWEALARLGEHGVAISAGECACTAVELGRLAGHVTYPQPSVTKIGGVSEFLAACASAKRHGRVPMPHSPYFGPGYHATLQLAAALEEIALFEYLWVEPKAFLGARTPLPANGAIAIPSGPGLGFEPDHAVLERFRIA